MKKINIVISLIMLCSSWVYAQCSAPCTYTFNDPPYPFALCSGTVTEAAPVTITHPQTEFAGIYDICNTASISGCPEPPSPPCQPIQYTAQQYNENQYSLSGSAGATISWATFNLSASVSGKQTTASSLTVNNNFCGWCNCTSADISQQDVTTSVACSFTATLNILGACAIDEPNGQTSWSEVLDTFTLRYLSPALIHQPSPYPGCVSSCN